METVSDSPRAPVRLQLPRAVWAVLGVGVAALAAGIVLIVLSQVGHGTPRAADPIVRVAAPGADAAAALLDGIPQNGAVLGSPDAPVTIVEYADLQCPYCRTWATYAFPELVRDYVRTGKAKLVFRGLAFLGPDSLSALRIALAAGLQNRLWNVVDLFYRNQGAENSGWVTDSLVASIAGSVPGLDAARVQSERTNPFIQGTITQTSREADEHKVQGTPAFAVGRTGGTLSFFKPASLDAAGFRPELDRLLA